MTRRQESKWTLEGLADADVCAAIRYLDPDLNTESNSEDSNGPFVIFASMLLLLLGGVALIWFYFRVLG